MFDVNKKIQPRVVLLLLFFIVCPSLTTLQAQITGFDQANLYLLPDFERFLDPDNLFVQVMIDSQEQTINAVDINIEFEPDKLSVDSLQFENSFCSIIISEKINNQEGIINITCGTENEIASSTINVALITFKKLVPGWTALSCNDSSVLASNGLGTNILNTTEFHNIYLVK
ncbi:hypothetical protein ACFLZ9_00210 [Patescibacteria group bacterium]